MAKLTKPAETARQYLALIALHLVSSAAFWLSRILPIATASDKAMMPGETLCVFVSAFGRIVHQVAADQLQYQRARGGKRYLFDPLSIFLLRTRGFFSLLLGTTARSDASNVINDA